MCSRGTCVSKQPVDLSLDSPAFDSRATDMALDAPVGAKPDGRIDAIGDSSARDAASDGG